jgi:uncharacterized protein with ATP-grasp and redox domains
MTNKFMNKYDSPIKPLPEPLSGSAINSFAHFTITERFPKIVRELLADNEFPSQVRQNLENLIQEILSSPLRPLNDDSAPDVQDWHRYITPYLGKNWLQVPWFFVEMFFYRRILEAIGYYQAGSLKGYDPFLKQKQRLLESASVSIRELGEQLEESLDNQHQFAEKQRADLQQLLTLDVWGNQADLSMWSASETRPDHQNSDDQRSHLLVDRAEEVFNYLTTLEKKPSRVDFILDNYGPELVHDIGLADYLLSTNMVSSIRFHAKPTPHYVSDAMIKDIYATIDYLAGRKEESVRRLATRIMEHIHEGRLELKEDFFWTSPLYFWEMPKHIHQELVESDLVISKGDANYRRLAGDLNWPPITPFEDVVCYFPTSLLALRVLKAELALGLTPEQVQKLEKQDPEWKVNGNWAVIQFYCRNTGLNL